MPYTFTLSHKIPASPQEIYDAWLDSTAHSEMTGGEARMSDAIGAEVSALDGYITGRNLQLIPGELIVQSWRTKEFADEHEDSVVTVTLEERADGALLTLMHSNVPDDQRSYEEGGWQQTYFEPMIAYFGGRAQGAAAPARRRPAPKTRRAAGKARRAPGARAKSTAPRAKARAAKRTKAKASAAKKAKRAGARTKRKPARAGSRKVARSTASRRAQKGKSGRRKKTRR